MIDFGIAKALDSATLASGPTGTPTYMSPEQFEGERVTPASDIFSWAGTMVFAATGRQPFAGQTVPALVNAVLSQDPDLSGVPAHLVDPLGACLAKDPAVRPSAADLLRHLIRPTGPTPSSARSEPATVPVNDADTDPPQTRKMSRRVLIGGAAAAGAAAISARRLPEQRRNPRTDRRCTGPSFPVTASSTPVRPPVRLSAPTPVAAAEPFGTEIKGPVPWPRRRRSDGRHRRREPPSPAAPPRGSRSSGTPTPPRSPGSATEAPAVTSVAIGTDGGTPVVTTGHADGRITAVEPDRRGARLAPGPRPHHRRLRRSPGPGRLPEVRQPA